MSAIYKNGVQYVGITDAANMSVDVGQNTLNLKDTVQNIINNFADTETNPSSGDHPIGDFFTYNGILYKVIDDIEQGDTLIVDTNIVQTSFGKQLEEADSNSFIYAETIEQLYEQINAIPLHQIRLFEINDELASILTNGTIASYYKGFVGKMDNEQHVFDFFGINASFPYLFRVRFETPSTPVIQTIGSSLFVNGTSINRAQVACQNSNTSEQTQKRLITESYTLNEDKTEYKTIQLISSRDGIKLEAQRREDDVWQHLWNTALMPRLSGGISIPANADLDNYKTVGTYYCSTTVDAATITNRPSGMNVAFVMYVSHGVGTGYPAQTIHEYDNGKTFYRVFLSNNTWTTWYTPAQSITGGASSIATSNLTASRALISNTSGKVGVSSVTTTELGYLSGATSTIQTQINGKAPTSHASSATTYGIGTGSNYGHVKLSDTYASTVANNAAANGMGASQKALYTAYNALSTSKQNNITGGASSIVTSNLTTSRVLVSSSAGKVATSSITPTQLGYLNGVTSAIQTQLNTKQNNLAWSYYTQNSPASVTCTTANTYYKAGANGVTFPAGKYIVIVHFQIAVTSTDKTPLITGAIGPNATDTGNPLRRITIKQQVNSGGYYFGKIVDFIMFNSQQTYYAWISSNLNNTTVSSGCWMDAIKFA